MIGNVAQGVQKTLAAHWKPMLPVALLLGFATNLFINLLDAGSETADRIEAGQTIDVGAVLADLFLGTMLILMVTLILDAIIFNMVVDAERTGSADLVDAFRTTMGRIGSLLILVVLSGLAVGLGLLLFVVPGVYVIVVLFPAVAVLYLEEKGAVASMLRSRQLVGKRFFEVFGLLVLLVVLGLVVGFAVGPFGFVGNVVASALSTLIGQSAIYHAYQQLVAESVA